MYGDNISDPRFMHYYNGVYLGTNLLKRLGFVLIIWIFIVIVSLILTGYETQFMFVVSLLSNVFLISFGMMLFLCYLLCRIKGKKMSQEKTIMHFHETFVSVWLSRLDTAYICTTCHSEFHGYQSKYCPVCGSNYCDQKTTLKNKERFIGIAASDSAHLFFLIISVTCIDAILCVYSLNDAELLTTFFVCFGFMYLLFFGLVILMVHYSNDEFDKPRFIEHTKCYGLHYMVFDTLPSFCPTCNYVMNVTDDPYCTKCGNPRKSSVEKDNKF